MLLAEHPAGSPGELPCGPKVCGLSRTGGATREVWKSPMAASDW